jgi:hypothetical protein
MSDQHQGPTRAAGALDAVVDSFGEGFRRMTWILFTGPHARITNWLWWGLILLLAGVAGWGNGSNGTGWEGDHNDFGGGSGAELAPLIVSLIVAGICCVLIVAVVFLYIRSRFRFVLLDGILRGQPRIREVWPRTSEVGLQYFIWELLLAIALILLAIPMLLLWIPVVRTAIGGGSVNPAMVLGPLFATIPYAVLLLFLAGMISLIVYDLALPLAWRREFDFWAGLRAALRLARDNPGAVILFLLARIVIGIAGVILHIILACCSCVIWIWPVAIAAGLVIVSVPFPPLLVITIPLAIALGILVAWIIVTVSAPIFLFYRGWSIAFVSQLDPSLGGWDDDASSEEPAPRGPETGPGAPAAPANEALRPPESSSIASSVPRQDRLSQGLDARESSPEADSGGPSPADRSPGSDADEGEVEQAGGPEGRGPGSS